MGGAPDRRQGELDRAAAAWPQRALQAQPQRRCVAAEGEFDGLAGQGLGLAVEHGCGGFGRPVHRPARPAGKVARPALLEGPSSARCFRCYLQRHISHGCLPTRLSPIDRQRARQFAPRAMSALPTEAPTSTWARQLRALARRCVDPQPTTHRSTVRFPLSGSARVSYKSQFVNYNTYDLATPRKDPVLKSAGSRLRSQHGPLCRANGYRNPDLSDFTKGKCPASGPREHSWLRYPSRARLLAVSAAFSAASRGRSPPSDVTAQAF